SSEGILIPVASAVGAAAVLIYARLLGRLAWKLNRLRPLRRRRSPAQQKEEPPAAASVSVEDPWAAPPPKRKKRKRPETITQAPEDYHLATEEAPAAPPPVRAPLAAYRPVGPPLPQLPPPYFPVPTNLHLLLARRP